MSVYNLITYKINDFDIVCVQKRKYSISMEQKATIERGEITACSREKSTNITVEHFSEIYGKREFVHMCMGVCVCARGRFAHKNE